MQQLIQLLQEQAQQIQAQAKQIQEQKEKHESSKKDMTPKKVRQEVTVKALNVPQGSRFKGYQEY